MKNKGLDQSVDVGIRYLPDDRANPSFMRLLEFSYLTCNLKSFSRTE